RLISSGAFQVQAIDAERRGLIDAFLRTLAEDRAERAIGVVLSGSGGDGTEGLRAIREHGGLTLAQTPETAKYDTMLRSAIDAGVVDEVLHAQAMPARLVERARQVIEGRGPVVTPPTRATPQGVPGPPDEELVASLDRVY